MSTAGEFSKASYISSHATGLLPPDNMDEEEIIHLEGYADQRVGTGIKRRGFQSRFKALKKQDKIICHLPIKGTKTTKEEWAQFYKERQSGRGKSGKIRMHAFYHFLKKEPTRRNSDFYYYAIPKGFTQTDLITLETDYDEMLGHRGEVYEFRVESRVSKKVGLCILRRKA